MSSSDPPWHSAFPQSSSVADTFPQRRALMVLSMKIASMLIVDVRRNDYEGGAIRGSINIPAQGFYWNRGILYELAYKADMEWVVFACGSCKENSRGARCAAWFLDHVRNTVGDTDMQVFVLEGGVKGWVKGGQDYVSFMDGYDKAHWDKLLADEKPEDTKKMESSESGSVPGPPADVHATNPSQEPPKEKVWSYESMLE